MPIESGPIFSYGFAKALILNGIDVYVILPENIENLSDWLQLVDTNHLYIIKNDLRIKKHPIKSFNELNKIRKFFKKITFDYCIDTFPNGQSRKIHSCLQSKNTLGIDHDVIPHSSTSSHSSINVNNALRYKTGIIVLSKTFVSLAREKYSNQKRIYYLRHGAMEYPVLSSQETYNDKFDINFLYFGRIDGYKGLHVLSEAYSNIVKKHENISLTVAGGGDFSEYENEYAILPNCTVVNKYLTDDDIAYYFSKPNTVVVLPYLDATQSGVIGMAFNYRTPVIVSDTGGLKEQLFDGEMGLFIEPGNTQDLEDKMKEFIINKELYEEQKEKMDSGYKKSTWDYVTKEFLAQLENTER